MISIFGNQILSIVAHLRFAFAVAHRRFVTAMTGRESRGGEALALHVDFATEAVGGVSVGLLRTQLV